MAELEKRIELLEYKLGKIVFSEAKEITMTNCPIGEVYTGNDCSLAIQGSSIGSVIDTDIDNAEGALDDLESRLDDIKSSIEEVESNLDGIKDAL